MAQPTQNKWSAGSTTLKPVFISGATGDRAGAINGPYSPTQEKGADGRVVNGKDGDASMCIEHFGGEWQVDASMCIEHIGGQWRVKHVEDKGKSACLGSVHGGCALEDCASRAWKLSDKLTDQPSVKIVTGAKTEREVGRPCIVYRACHSARCALIPSCCAGCRVCCCHSNRQQRSKARLHQRLKGRCYRRQRALHSASVREVLQPCRVQESWE
jgi:hypothetical protein